MDPVSFGLLFISACSVCPCVRVLFGLCAFLLVFCGIAFVLPGGCTVSSVEQELVRGL